MPRLVWQDVADQRPPHLMELLGQSAVASLSVRAIGPRTDLGEGYVTLGAGNRARVDRNRAGDAVDAGEQIGPNTGAAIYQALTGHDPAGAAVLSLGHRGRPGRRRPPALRLRARRHGEGHRGRRPVGCGHRQRRRRSADGRRAAAPRSRAGDDGHRGTRRRRHRLEGPHRRRSGRAGRPAHGPGRRARRLRRRLVRAERQRRRAGGDVGPRAGRAQRVAPDGTGARRGPRQPPAPGRRDARAAAAAGRPRARPGHRRQPGRARRLRPADGVRTGGAGGRARPGPQRHDAPRRLRDAPRRRRDGPRLARPATCRTA